MCGEDPCSPGNDQNQDYVENDSDDGHAHHDPDDGDHIDYDGVEFENYDNSDRLSSLLY